MTKEVAKTEGQALVTQDFAVRGFSAQELKDLLTENVGTGGLSQFDLDHVKVPSGGGTIWEVPGLEGIEETKVIKAVVVLWKETRAYWENPLEESGGGRPPDCSSNDNMLGIGNPGGDCTTCPFSMMGSAKKGKGQACKQVRHLFIIREGDILPMVVDAPPTSLQPMKQFFLRMVSKGVPFYGALINIELESDRNDQGIKYSKLKPSIDKVLTKDEAQFFKAYKESLDKMVGSHIASFAHPVDVEATAE